MKIGFTGTRHGLAELQRSALRGALRAARPWDFTDLHHGDCLGADEEAAGIAVDLGFYVVSHPPIKRTYRAWAFSHETRLPEEYLKRDRIIVEEADVLVACPRTTHEQRRSGTWYTIRYAREVGKPVMIIRPDGAIDDSRAAA